MMNATNSRETTDTLEVVAEVVHARPTILGSSSMVTGAADGIGRWLATRFASSDKGQGRAGE